MAPIYSWDMIKTMMDDTPKEVLANVVLSEITGTTSGTINTVTTHAHGLGVVPKIVIIIPTGPSGSAGVIQMTTRDATNISIRSQVASVTFIAFCIA